MVPAEDASSQKTIEKLAGSQSQEQRLDIIFQRISLIRHLLNKLQANLSLSDTTHSIQQKILSLPNLIIGTVQEMLFQAGNDFCPACESNTWVWHEWNGHIGCPSVAKVIDVDL